MAARLFQAPLPWLPAGAEEIAPGVGLVAGPDGGGVAAVGGGHRLQTVPRADRRRTRVRCRPGSCLAGVDLAWVRSCRG